VWTHEWTLVGAGFVDLMVFFSSAESNMGVLRGSGVPLEGHTVHTVCARDFSVNGFSFFPFFSFLAMACLRRWKMDWRWMWMWMWVCWFFEFSFTEYIQTKNPMRLCSFSRIWDQLGSTN
jgi:hypothetical protein